jgi:hypothetical protein
MAEFQQIALLCRPILDRWLSRISPAFQRISPAETAFHPDFE